MASIKGQFMLHLMHSVLPMRMPRLLWSPQMIFNNNLSFLCFDAPMNNNNMLRQMQQNKLYKDNRKLGMALTKQTDFILDSSVFDRGIFTASFSAIQDIITRWKYYHNYISSPFLFGQLILSLPPLPTPTTSTLYPSFSLCCFLLLLMLSL